MRQTKKPATSVPASRYEPTGEEQSALKTLEEHAAKAVRIKVFGAENIYALVPDHPDEKVGRALLAQALGTADQDFIDGLLQQLSNVSPKESEAKEFTLNFMLSVVKNIKPRDHLETMLAAQMAAVHMSTMAVARQLAHAQFADQQDSAERAFNKLSRTFLMQMEALKRYRTGGEQKMTVQHVTVAEGGQAIVGNVTQTPSKNASKPAPPALTDARTEPMPILSERAKVPVLARSGLKK